MSDVIGQCFKDEMGRIQKVMTEATPLMVSAFMKTYWVRLTTVRIWAEQGVLSVVDGVICKDDAPPATPTAHEREQMVQAIKQMISSEVE